MTPESLRGYFPGIPVPRPPSRTEIKRVGVLGGGTAGYLTALALRKQIPSLEVTVLESSKIPVIGVGEATTPLLPKLLHLFLGLDVNEFYKQVQPTWKLGIKFEWGKPLHEPFNFPFDTGLLMESQLYTGSVNSATAGARLMSSERVPLMQTGGNSYSPAFHRIPYAYHLENRRFVAYLNKQLAGAGVTLLDRVVEDARLTENGDRIACLLTDGGEEFEFDLYVDCSGFRSVLLEKALGSRFVSYASSLFTDSALVGVAPNDGHIKPYTLASTMDNGWCWNIPHMEADHLGYVFSSAFCTLDDAEREMREKYPRMKDTHLISFRSGRHEHFWYGNAVAVGNSYGFVEPLESTALHMIAEEINWLISCFPRSRDEVSTRDYVNKRVNGEWDMLRAFLSIHYKFNAKRDTPFWHECRERTDVSLAQGFLDLFKERAPLSYCSRELRPFDDHLNNQFGRYGWDNVLMGLGVEGRYVDHTMTREDWDLLQLAGDRLLEKAMPHREALEVLAERGDLLTGFVEGPDSWLPEMCPTILRTPPLLS